MGKNRKGTAKASRPWPLSKRSLSKNLLAILSFAKVAVVGVLVGASWTSIAVAESDVDSSANSFEAMDLIEAFKASSEGYSSDELIIRDDLREPFIARLAKRNAQAQQSEEAKNDHFERDALLALLQLRKSGKLSVRSTRRGQSVDESVYPIAEIAARVVTDRHRIGLDTMLADPVYRSELSQEAKKIDAEVDDYAVRKAVLGLRKRRALKPELVLRVADWGREIKTYSIEQLKGALDASEISTGPGVYLFRVSDGYLYVGEAKNLAERLTTHLTESDRESLAEFLSGDASGAVTVELHVFPRDSPASKVTVRRAYESELIRSRNPRFNVRP
ncbi:GIY-YIG nuclease family protein [Novipirellula herctigrandis]